MADSILSAPHFHDEEAAYAWAEARLWANGRVCPHCGTIDESGKLKGKSTRIGVYKCYSCRKPFTVKVGTIFESSHIEIYGCSPSRSEEPSKTLTPSKALRSLCTDRRHDLQLKLGRRH